MARAAAAPRAAPTTVTRSPSPYDLPEDVPAAGPQREADPHLRTPLGHCVAEHPIHADHREQDGDSGEHAQKRGGETRSGNALLYDGREGLRAEKHQRGIQLLEDPSSFRSERRRPLGPNGGEGLRLVPGDLGHWDVDGRLVRLVRATKTLVTHHTDDPPAQPPEADTPGRQRRPLQKTGMPRFG